MSASRELLWGALRRMAKTRLAELFIAQKYPEQKMRCPTHLCLGQESTGAAFGALAAPGDVFFGNYRSHGHYLSKGGGLLPMFAELLGLAGGCSEGLGGSMHLIDLERGFYGSSAIVGSTVPIASGAALKFKMKREPHVAVAFFGDAAMEEGVVYETANLAALHALPLVFVCENNRLAILTPLEQRSSAPHLHRRFEAMGIRGLEVDGRDVEAVLGAAEQAYLSARQGRPFFVECHVSRWAVHVGHQFQGPVDAWWQDPAAAGAEACPMACCVRKLLDGRQGTLDDVRRLREEVQKEVEDAYAAALKSPPPSPAILKDGATAGRLLSTLPSAHREAEPTREAHREQSPLVNPF